MFITQYKEGSTAALLWDYCHCCLLGSGTTKPPHTNLRQTGHVHSERPFAQLNFSQNGRVHNWIFSRMAETILFGQKAEWRQTSRKQSFPTLIHKKRKGDDRKYSAVAQHPCSTPFPTNAAVSPLNETLQHGRFSSVHSSAETLTKAVKGGQRVHPVSKLYVGSLITSYWLKMLI